MEVEALRDELHARGGACDVWLVYLADRFGDWRGGRPLLVLQAAFFTRGEAYAFAEGQRNARMWQHYYVFRVLADIAWIDAGTSRTPDFETAFGRDRELPVVSVTPTEIAAVVP